VRIAYLSIGVLLLISAAASWGQQAPTHKASRAELLNNLHSDHAEVRSKAYEQLRSDPAALRDATVQAALVSLLDRENQETLSGSEEDYAEYVSWLAQTVAKVVDWNDSRQVCILANSVDPPEELTDHARVAVPCLLQKSRSNSALTRGVAVALLVQALAKGRSELDAGTIQTVQQVILNGLRDPDEGVRIPTVEALEHFGGIDMIPALRVVAETDPDPSEGHAIRKWAAKAIAAIQKRAAASDLGVPPHK